MRALALLLFAACAKPTPVADPVEPILRDLETQEGALRKSTVWNEAEPSDVSLGPDPIDVVALAGGGFAGVLRGRDSVVVLDATGREVRRIRTVRAPRALAVEGDTAFVAGELSSDIGVHDIAADPASAHAPERRIHVDGVSGLRSIALGAGGRIYVLDVDGNLLALERDGKHGPPIAIGAFALGLRVERDYIVAMSVLAHVIVAIPFGVGGSLDVKNAVHVDNDGPFWGFDTRSHDGALWIAAGHVEDHALDRRGGSFGYIDSFVRVVRVPFGQAPETVLEMNVGERGVVIPKAVRFIDDHTVLAVGSGSGRALRLSVDSSKSDEVKALPGIAGAVVTPAGFVGASPLLDAFVLVDATGARAVPVADDDARSSASRLGEALVFTTIMAPRQKSDGELSRFTCEACHFEGQGDGRIHATGRGDIVATTKPLTGLFNDKPLFTRALDPNLTRMAHAEFRVANANSTLDPWFALTAADAPWLAVLGVVGTQSPADLRHALVSFLYDFTPRTNPHVVGKRAFDDLEMRGAEVFRARCASCHAARLVGDDPTTGVPDADWQARVLASNGPLTWSHEGRVKTGVEPYVHEEGARPSSLRRIWAKRPYFTNGSAATLEDVVAGARFDDATFMHAAGGAKLRAFDVDEQRALVAFLRLL